MTTSTTRQFYRVADGPNRANGLPTWQILSNAGGDIIAENIPAKHIAEAMRQAAEKETSKK